MRMKLSDAMMLGSVTCRMEPGNWNSCALGAAANAVGIPRVGREALIREEWPWLTEEYTPNWSLEAEIAWRFDRVVCKGWMTLEQLIDWVRENEPPLLALPVPCALDAETVEGETAYELARA